MALSAGLFFLLFWSRLKFPGPGLTEATVSKFFCFFLSSAFDSIKAGKDGMSVVTQLVPYPDRMARVLLFPSFCKCTQVLMQCGLQQILGATWSMSFEGTDLLRPVWVSNLLGMLPLATPALSELLLLLCFTLGLKSSLYYSE